MSQVDRPPKTSSSYRLFTTELLAALGEPVKLLTKEVRRALSLLDHTLGKADLGFPGRLEHRPNHWHRSFPERPDPTADDLLSEFTIDHPQRVQLQLDGLAMMCTQGRTENLDLQLYRLNVSNQALYGVVKILHLALAN